METNTGSHTDARINVHTSQTGNPPDVELLHLAQLLLLLFQSLGGLHKGFDLSLSLKYTK